MENGEKVFLVGFDMSTNGDLHTASVIALNDRRTSDGKNTYTERTLINTIKGRKADELYKDLTGMEPPPYPYINEREYSGLLDD